MRGAPTPEEIIHRPGKPESPEVRRLLERLAEIPKEREFLREAVAHAKKWEKITYDEKYRGRKQRAVRSKVASLTAGLATTAGSLLIPKQAGGPGSPQGKKAATEIEYKKPSAHPEGRTMPYPTPRHETKHAPDTAQAIPAAPVSEDTTYTEIPVPSERVPDTLGALPVRQVDTMPIAQGEPSLQDTIASKAELPPVVAEYPELPKDTLAEAPAVGTQPLVVEPEPYIAKPITAVLPKETPPPAAPAPVPTEAPAKAAAPTEAVEPLPVRPRLPGGEVAPELGIARPAKEKPGHIGVTYEKPEDNPANNPPPAIHIEHADTTTAPAVQAPMEAADTTGEPVDAFMPGYADTTEHAYEPKHTVGYPHPKGQGTLKERSYKTTDMDRTMQEVNFESKIPENLKNYMGEDSVVQKRIVEIETPEGRKLVEKQVKVPHIGWESAEGASYEALDTKRVTIEGGKDSLRLPSILEYKIDHKEKHSAWPTLVAHGGLESQKTYLDQIERNENIGPWGMALKSTGMCYLMDGNNKLKVETPFLFGENAGDEPNTFASQGNREGKTTPAGIYWLVPFGPEDKEAQKALGHDHLKFGFRLVRQLADGTFADQGIAFHGELLSEHAAQEEAAHSGVVGAHARTTGCIRVPTMSVERITELLQGRKAFKFYVLPADQNKGLDTHGNVIETDDAQRLRDIGAGVDAFLHAHKVKMLATKQELRKEGQDVQNIVIYQEDPNAPKEIVPQEVPDTVPVAPTFQRQVR